MNQYYYIIIFELCTESCEIIYTVIKTSMWFQVVQPDTCDGEEISVFVRSYPNRDDDAEISVDTKLMNNTSNMNHA